MQKMLGYELFGEGPNRVIVMHDWFSDRSTWDPIRPYLAVQDFTYAFVDFRGYGSSMQMEGHYTLEEAAADVLAVTDHLKWDRFAVIGHSMSGLVMQRLAQLVPDKITAGIGVTSVAPTSMQLPPQMNEMSKKLAMASDERRLEVRREFWGSRLSEPWNAFKIKRWGETADRRAAAAYVDMWGNTDISHNASKVTAPLLFIAAEQDAPPFQLAAIQDMASKYYKNYKVVSIQDSGHYPMQETPPLLATLMERFLNDAIKI